MANRGKSPQTFPQIMPHQRLVLLVLFSLVMLNGCAATSTKHPTASSLFLPPPPAGISARHTPAFLVKDPAALYNRIGTPSARLVDGNTNPEIFVNPDKSTIYFERQEFSTAKSRYTNLIFRIHFREVPSGWGQFNLTAGKNPGLLFIYTLNEHGTLILVTTVHTCGCFLAFLPTADMPAEALPPDWSAGSQHIYGYDLPSLLQFSSENPSDRLVYTLESENHRISDVTVTGGVAINATATKIPMDIQPMHALNALVDGDLSTSFFEQEGPRKGYVKDNSKIFERLFISWWAFDLHVGEDKAFGGGDKSDTIFYTSLKFWARKESDLKNFPDFLTYWGWRL